MKKFKFTLILTALAFTWIYDLPGLDPEVSGNAVLSGYIKDASNGETLIGATVYISELHAGTITNVYGFYSLSVPPAVYETEVYLLDVYQ